MFAQSKVYAKPGELLQGALPGYKRFLLSNKSSLFFLNTTEVGIARKSNKQQLSYKSQKTIDLFWSSLSSKKQLIDISKLYFKMESNIPVGKGLSSSSADVLGLLTALSVFYKTEYTIQQLYDLAADVEPTDPCLHSGNLIFGQDNGNIHRELLPIPYYLIYFDSDKKGLVDTVSLSQTVKYSDQDLLTYESLCKRMEAAAKDKDYETFNDCLNKSAERNEVFLPKRKFNILQDFASTTKTGLFVAHSGTYMGLVVEPSRIGEIKTKAQELINKHWDTTIYIE